MPLTAGTRLGSFVIEGPLGAGGMGEVYKARDTRLDRTVAIKILPSAEPELKARFEQEARAIAGLHHPHICTLYDVGHEDSSTRSGPTVDYMVLEYLEGETLAQRLTRGPLKQDEALRVAIAVAEALDEAHRAGIVHRDLKPGNIMLTRSGVKLLDFGLAKLRPTAPAVSGLSLAATAPGPVTSQGTILGTLYYMAPEQVEGQEADTRTDMFAFGVVLYEMLTATKAFDGKTQASVIAAILEREPTPLATLQPLTPPLADAIVRKCLAKNAADRWQSAADLASALRWALDGTKASGPAASPLVSRRRPGVIGAMAALVLVALAGGWFGWRYASSDTAPAPAVRFEVLTPAGVTLSPSPVASAAQLALSPDGRQLAFVAATKFGASQIWLRPLDSVQGQALAGTEGASFPFWSPDSRFIAFFAAGKLKKIDTRGGTPQTLADSTAGRGGTWNQDDVILFTAQASSPVSRISGSGGTVTPVTTFDAEQGFTQYWPQFLPDGRHFLYYQRSVKGEHTGTYVASLDTSQSTRILDSGARAVYASGHLLFVRDGILFAQAFDERTLQTSGELFRVADGVGYWATAFAYTAVTASGAGVLAHGPSIVFPTSLRWHDRAGATMGTLGAPRAYGSPRLSPDQASLMVAITDATTAQPDLWQLTLARGTMSRVTSDQSSDWFPVWSADGSRVFFGSARTGSTTIFQQSGVSPAELFSDSFVSIASYPNDVSGDGRFMVYQQFASGGYNLGVIPLSGDRTPMPFVTGPSNEVQGRFSPNQRWMAYASDESGQFEVYVRPFPSQTTQSIPISIGGGMQPEWRRDGKELFYMSADGKLTAVPVVADEATFTAGAPRALFDVEVPEATAPYPTHYAVTADGQRFLVNTVIDQPTRPALTVILNWPAALNK